MSALDPIELAQALIRRPSVTPADAGAMAVVEQALTGMGFTCRRMAYQGIENLYARLGTTSPNLCFAGHTDVVPTGDAAQWRHDPFAGTVKDGELHGRGAADMKGGIAAWIAAVSEILAQGPVKGSLSFLITGDEEGVAEHGTVRVVEALKAEGEVIDHCVVGEPSSAEALGDMVKVGRRGSMNAWIEVEGMAGHVAYPDRAANPIPVLVRLLDKLAAHRLDEGYPEFQPSNLEITGLEVDNPATNVIPPAAKGRLNIRFNPRHTGESLVRWLQDECREAEIGFKGRVKLTNSISGEAFLTRPDRFVELAAEAVRATVGRTPVLSTTGGTSDARFIRALCPVIELGLVGATMHKIDERVPVQDVRDLTRIYAALIGRYFETMTS